MNTGFDERTIIQSVVLLKAKVRAGALPMPLAVELADGRFEGWRKAATDYLIARSKGERYAPATLEKVNWEEEAGNAKGK